MATLTALYNFEGNIESGFKSWLADSMIELYQQIEFETLPDDYIGVQLTPGEITGHYNPSAGTSGQPEYDQYNCTVDFVIRTQRYNDEAEQTTSQRSRHQELVAQVRYLVSLSQAKGSALETYLGDYQFQFLRPAGTNHSVDGEFDETTLTFNGQFSILPSAWP